MVDKDSAETALFTVNAPVEQPIRGTAAGHSSIITGLLYTN